MSRPPVLRSDPERPDLRPQSSWRTEDLRGPFSDKGREKVERVDEGLRAGGGPGSLGRRNVQMSEEGSGSRRLRGRGKR